MAPKNLRLRLTVQRHGVPEVKIVWSCNPSPDTTISNLLEQINKAVPLESGEWGLEDYVVELISHDGAPGYECLHYQQASDILKDEDQLVIRCLLGDELRRRRLNGRHQISTDGRHLVDGVVFGRPWLRSPRGRPSIELPPRKRSRIMEPDDYMDQDDDMCGNGEHEIRGYIETPDAAEGQETSDDESYQTSEESSDISTDIGEEDAATTAQSATSEKASESDHHDTESCTSSSVDDGENGGNTSSSSSDENPENSNREERDSLDHDESTTSHIDSESNSSCSESASEYTSRHVAGESKHSSAAGDVSCGVVDKEEVNNNNCSGKAKNASPLPDPSKSQPSIKDPNSPVPPGKGSKKTWKRNERRRAYKEALKRQEMEQLSVHKERLLGVINGTPAEAGSPSVKMDQGVLEVNGTRQESKTTQPPKFDIFRPTPMESNQQTLGSNDWSSKIDYYAVECKLPNVELSQPPFPFLQRWDDQVDWSNQQQWPNGNDWKNGRQGLNSRHGPNSDNLKNGKDQTSVDNWRRKRPCEMSFYSGDPYLADETTNTGGEPELKKQRLEEKDAVGTKSCQDDLPPVPKNILSLPVLKPQTGLEGKVLTWGQLMLSRHTQWQPQYVQRTGVVMTGSDDKFLTIRLAMRDRQDAARQFDPKTGEPIYDMFEVPVDADEEDTNCDDDGEVRLSWEEMVEPKLIPLDSN
ncbi:hypothetical protein CDD82_1901 [Ophiocordyceps australis]|uniref:DUF7357 domain-containing protein n=1 Tax=Ophiocordyceps australis TaxID=1399860 RepID=A0A2C5ZKF8_9HYPO|nr:hypothetical protein CDD82_1901 [Ophiocordyceps australis]